MNSALRRKEAKPAPKQARARARATAILEAAKAIVTEGSVDDLTTTRLAVRAGVPVGSIYRYFDDRADILDRLYRAAYDEVEAALIDAQQSIPPGTDPGMAIRQMVEAFWRAARAHPRYRALTRWANSHYSLWDVTPGTGSNLVALIEATLEGAGVAVPKERRAAATKTMVTTISILADLSLEADDEGEAGALIDELALLLEAYIGTFG